MKIEDLFEEDGKRYQWKDGSNLYTLYVGANGAVTLKNQNNIALSLANVGFMIDSANGYKEKSDAVKKAAQGGFAELKRVTQLPWKEA